MSQPFSDDSPYGYKLHVNDGSGEVQVYFHQSAGFDAATLRALSVGQHIQVAGFAGRYESVFEVDPRQPSDVVLRYRQLARSPAARMSALAHPAPRWSE